KIPANPVNVAKAPINRISQSSSLSLFFPLKKDQTKRTVPNAKARSESLDVIVILHVRVKPHHVLHVHLRSKIHFPRRFGRCAEKFLRSLAEAVRFVRDEWLDHSSSFAARKKVLMR